MPRQRTYELEEAKELLNEYVRPEECAASTLPRDLAPDQASSYIKDELAADFGHVSMARAMEVVRYYVLRDRIQQLGDMLKGGEKTANDLKKSCHVIVAMSELGAPGEQEHAEKEYRRLLGDKIAEDGKNLEVLVETSFSLPPSTNFIPIVDRVTAIRTKAERTGPENQLWRFRECDKQLLPWVRQEKGRKDWLINMPKGPERNRRWVESYLMYDMKTPFKWDVQAGFGLLSVAKEVGDEAIVTAATEAMSRIDPKNEPDDVVRFRKTRGYHVREYFLETLPPELKRDQKSSMEMQDDLIQ